MDIEMQMEAQGLPTKFDSTSDPPEPSHLASNVAASKANAESPALPVSEIQPAPVQPPVTSTSAVLQKESTVSPAAPNGVLHEAEAPTQNGLSDIGSIVNNDTPVPDSQPQPGELPPSVPEPAVEMPTASLEESVVPSSIPAEIIPSKPFTEPAQSAPDTLLDTTVIPQPPTSDLRSLPHADALSPAAVAAVEEQKHEEDNAVAELVDPSASNLDVEQSTVVPPAPESSAVEESTKVNATGLATPTQSPPPAPQPEPATLPQSPPALPATEIPEPAVLPLNQPAEPEPSIEVEQDQVMTDIASPPVKVAREREEDTDEVEPVAKRIKTDDEQTTRDGSEFKIPEGPTAASPTHTNGTPAPTSAALIDGDDTVTLPRLTHMKKVISNLKKSNASQAFRTPVDPVALGIPTYLDVVKEPMDLGTIDNKLKQTTYTTVSDFIYDFNLIVDNCVKFNGPEHAITQGALKMQSSFNNQMTHLPKAGFAEPSKEERRAAKAKQEPTRTAPPRRPSVSTSAPPVQGTARSPKSSTSAQAFAVGPDGVPLIRRDSTVADGRPKRQIVPTKRNQEYAGGRPKKKKYELQLRFCQEALKEITTPKHWQINQYFTHPVDPVALNIPTYFQIVKKPMDLGTVQTKLDNNVYEKARDFEEDVHLVFKNCYKFNPEGDYVNQCGHQLEDMFDKKWATKDDWIAAREPASEPQSDEEDEEEEESEEDGEDSEVERNEKIANLQKAIAEMSKQMGELTQTKKKKKSKSPSSQPKKTKTKSSKKDKPKATFPGLQKSEKKKSVPKKPEKERYVTFAEKQYISNGISMLPEKQMQEALRIIQQSVPSLANSDQNEIELDIEEVPNHALLKLLQFVRKYAGPPPDEPKAEEYAAPAATVTKSKKSKPLTKHDQEREIEELQGKLGAYARGPVSPGAVQSIEEGDSSDDDGDSEESEEE